MSGDAIDPKAFEGLEFNKNIIYQHGNGTNWIDVVVESGFVVLEKDGPNITKIELQEISVGIETLKKLVENKYGS